MKHLLLVLCVFASLPLLSQTDAQQQLIRETIAKYQSHKSIAYDIDYMMKFFDSDTPNYVQSHVQIIRDDLDSVFRSRFLFSRGDTKAYAYKYYTPPYLYLIDLPATKVTRSDASKGYTSSITGSIDGDVLKVYFSDIERLQKKLTNPAYKVQYTDSAGFLVISIALPDDDDFHDMLETVSISKDTRTITARTYRARYQDQVQRNHWKLANISFDQVTDADLASQVTPFLTSFKTEDYKPLTKEDLKLLDNGADAPTLTGTFFPDYDRTVALTFNKVSVLDFWYTSCMPCIKAIPALNQLKQKYQDKIDIIGINPLEYKPEEKKQIDAFLNRTPIDYSILLLPQIPEAYNIRVYPTLYVVDQYGKVRYSKVGLSDNLYEALDKVLGELTQGQ